MQFRRVTISVFLVFLALWVGEVPHSDAEAAVNNMLHVLRVIGTRWKSATQVAQIVVQLADKSGLSYSQPPTRSDEDHEVSSDWCRTDRQGFERLVQLAHVAIPSNDMPVLPDNSDLTQPTSLNDL